MESFHEKIFQIEKVISDNDHEIKKVGLREGNAGIAMFYLYLYKYSRSETYLDKTNDYLNKSFKILHDGVNLTELVEFINVLIYFEQLSLIERKDLIDILESLQPLLEIYLAQQIKSKNLDGINGLVAIGNCLLQTHPYLNQKDNIDKIVATISNLSIDSNKGIYWKFNFRNKARPIVELGLNHGIGGVTNLLVNVYKKFPQNELYKLIVSSTGFLLNQMDKEQKYYFPHSIEENKFPRYANMAYGDIGISFLLLKMKKVKFEYYKVGMDVFSNLSLMSLSPKDMTKDASLTYGSSGLLAFLSNMSSKYGISVKHQIKEWYQISWNKNHKNTKWAGYETYINGFDKSIQLSFAYGLSGIGTALIDEQLSLGHNYIKLLNYV